MQFWYEFRCTFHVEFISFIVCFISSLQTILKISVIEFKNVGFDFGNCQCFNPAKLNKVIVLWPMTCQEWKSASVLIVGSQTRSKKYIATDLIYQGIDGTETQHDLISFTDIESPPKHYHTWEPFWYHGAPYALIGCADGCDSRKVHSSENKPYFSNKILFCWIKRNWS